MVNIPPARVGRVARRALLIALVFAFAGFPSEAGAAPGDVGHEGPSSTGAGSAPTGSKPESKLWWNDGFWWGSLWDGASADFHIFRLDPASQSWVDTGVALDDRPSTRADVLWDGGAGKLYVASHRFTESPSSGTPSRLYRYSYNSVTNTYTRDAGFPVSINNFRTETLVIAKDSTGQLWATWTQGNQVWINQTLCNPTCDDRAWGTGFVISPTAVRPDDISSVIAFGGNKIGVMWSNQNTATDLFAVHNDSQPDNVWAIENALQGPGLADDHINLKADSTGRVLAAVKTSKSSANDPLNLLLVRSPGGGWSSHVFGLVKDKHTRPIVQLDEEHSIVHMFATSPASGGTIYEKTSPVSSISFSPGLGTPFVKDADRALNNATSTKQNLSSSTGLVVMALNGIGNYFHNYRALGGSGGTPPSANFAASPTSGTTPLAVSFSDTSSGAPNAWAWDFQNDGIVDSNVRNPSFTYTTPGTYTVELTVSNSAGSSTLTKTNFITVSPQGGGSPVTFMPTDDAFVRSNFPNQTAGEQPTLRAYRNPPTETHSYLKFSVTGVTGPVSSVKLRLRVSDASATAGRIYAVANTTWSESTITWATKPEMGALLASGGSAPLGAWVEFDLGTSIAGNGAYTVVLKDGGTDGVWYSSKEGSSPPQLVVTFGS